jgi:hypothetical protein
LISSIVKLPFPLWILGNNMVSNHQNAMIIPGFGSKRSLLNPWKIIHGGGPLPVGSWSPFTCRWRQNPVPVGTLASCKLRRGAGKIR